MSAGKIIAYIGAAIMIFFGVLFMWGAGDSTGGGASWVVIGIISIAIGFGLIFFASRKSKSSSSEAQNVTLNIDLPGNVNLDGLKCQSCGGALTSDDIKMVAGAPMVTCPYCHTTYQLTENPKW